MKERCQNWAHLKEGTPFNEIFPDGQVPLISIFPVVPREAGSPLCYIIDAKFLSQAQVDCLAEKLFEEWRSECSSLQDAKNYIIAIGLPLKTDWFNTVFYSSPATLFGLMDDEVLLENDDSDNWLFEDEEEYY